MPKEISESKTAKPEGGFHKFGMDFERRVSAIQNQIRTNHEVHRLSFDKRHSDEFSWFNAVGKAIWELPVDVVALVIAARRVLDIGHMAPEFNELDKAVEAFSERVPYDDEP